MKERICKEKIWSEDIGDGYSGHIQCGGRYECIGQTNLYQCSECKKVIELTHPIIKKIYENRNKER